MSETVLILRAQKWEMSDERTGEIRKGCTVYYINDYQEETPTAVGGSPLKLQASDEVFQTVKQFKAPGIYEIDTRSKPGKDGVTTMVMVRAKFKSTLLLLLSDDVAPAPPPAPTRKAPK